MCCWSPSSPGYFKNVSTGKIFLHGNLSHWGNATTGGSWFFLQSGNALALLCAVCFATLITYLGSYAEGTDTGILVFFMAVTQAVMEVTLFLVMDFASFSPPSINWGSASFGLGFWQEIGFLSPPLCKPMHEITTLSFPPCCCSHWNPSC